MLFGPVTALIYIRKTSIQTQKPNAWIRTTRVMRIPKKKLTISTYLLTLRLLLAGDHKKISPIWTLRA